MTFISDFCIKFQLPKRVFFSKKKRKIRGYFGFFFFFYIFLTTKIDEGVQIESN
jgi:hypothetical protein